MDWPETHSDLEGLGVLIVLLKMRLLGALGHLAQAILGWSNSAVSLVITLNFSLLNHFAEDSGGGLASLSFLLGISELLLQLVKLGELLINGLLSKDLLCLLISDLPVSPPSLHSSLEHIGTNALLGYNKRK